MLTPQDVDFLCCPACRSDLQMQTNLLLCKNCGKSYPVINGIPRLLHFPDGNTSYNEMWDYKWTKLDGGIGYNYQIIEEGSISFKIHNIFQHFQKDGNAFHDIDDQCIGADIGCGTGQYSISLLQKGIKRIYSVDLTRGVDIGHEIIKKKYPQFADKIVFIQANARYLPIKSDKIDIVMSLASIHHSGYLEDCVKELVRITKPSKRFFIWVYEKPILPIMDKYRKNIFSWLKLASILFRISYMEFLYVIFKRMPNSMLVSILRILASNSVYKLRHIPKIGRVITYLTPRISEHPDRGYRLINLYDWYSPSFAEGTDEYDVMRWSEKFKFKIISFIPWRLGFVGQK